MYWNPNYCSVTIKPIDEDSVLVDDSYIDEIFSIAKEKGKRVVNGENNLPKVDE